MPFSSYSLERTITFTLEISTILMPKHKKNPLSGRSWCLRDLLRLWSYLHWLESIWKHLDQRYVALFSRFMIYVVSISIFGYLVFHYDRFRELKIDFHAPHEIQGMRTKWSRVPNKDVVLESVTILSHVLFCLVFFIFYLEFVTWLSSLVFVILHLTGCTYQFF